MPKKFNGENTKAVAAKQRKAAAQEAELARKVKAQEDALWKDDDKKVIKKIQRREEKDKKKAEVQEKKAEKNILLQKEIDSIVTTSKQPVAKITRHQIQAETEKRNAAAIQAAAANKPKPPPQTHLTQPLEENLNKLLSDTLSARSVTEALDILKVDDSSVDLHPERRLRAAYLAFEETNLPRVKDENPTLRLSQLKQLIKKEWNKSPDNPLVKA